MKKVFALAAFALSVCACENSATMNGGNIRTSGQVWPYNGNLSVGIDGISGGAYPSPSTFSGLLRCTLKGC